MSNGTEHLGSGGSMNNPKYRSICVDGYYIPQSGRTKTRNGKRMKGVSLHQNKKFWDL